MPFCPERIDLVQPWQNQPDQGTKEGQPERGTKADRCKAIASCGTVKKPDRFIRSLSAHGIAPGEKAQIAEEDGEGTPPEAGDHPSGFALRIEPQQAQGVQRDQNRRPGIGHDRDPQTGQSKDGRDQKHGFEPQRESDVLPDIGHRGP